jgi:hypothetical protein
MHSKPIKLLLFAIVCFACQNLYAQYWSAKETIKSELYTKVDSQFSSYDILDTIVIADTIPSYFYRMYLVDSIYSVSDKKATLKIYYCGKSLNDKLEIGQSYIVKSYKTNPLVFTKMASDTIVFISDDLTRYKRDCMVKVSKKTLKKDPDCIPVVIDYYRIKKIKVLPRS